MTPASQKTECLERARAARRRGDLAGARALIETIGREAALDGLARLELARIAFIQRDTGCARRMLEELLEETPSHVEAWTMLADVLRAEGEPERAGRAHLKAVSLGSADPVLMRAAIALGEGRLSEAERALKARLKQRPSDVAAIRMLAEVAGRIGRYSDAAKLLERAVELAPDFEAARHNLALVYHRQNRSAEAMALVDTLLASETENPAYGNLKAAILTRIGDHAAAAAAYRAVLERLPAQPKAWMSLGHVLKTLGDLDEAIAAYREAIALMPQLGEAWWSLANLKTHRFTPAELAEMRHVLAREGLDMDDRLHLEFALGKALEDAGEYQEAFALYASANRHRRAVIAYDREATSHAVEARCAVLSPSLFAERTDWGAPSPAPIFIVSLPRAGSTLVEQILASHPDVEGTAELPVIARLVGQLAPERIARLTREELRGLGEEYLREAALYRKTDRPFFIDKMPNNWLHAGLIHLMLPKARIIDVRRDAMACCFSNFKQHFARGQHFTYDLTDLGHYYRDYLKMMDHLDASCPGALHHVRYEALVEEPQVQIPALLAALGLPYDPACLAFHANTRAVATASSQQVRQPMYREALTQWRHFEPWLAPLRAALAPPWPPTDSATAR